MHFIKSQFVFNAQQRLGILLLLIVITSLLGVYFFIEPSETESFDISSAEVVLLQDQLDSLRAAELERRKPKRYPFNPNFITDYKAYALGMSPEAYDRLKSFRDDGKWINSATDFKRVTGVSDSLLADLSPWFKFPDWVTDPKPKKKQYAAFDSERSFSEKIDLNTASEEQLIKIYGIGEALSKRIVQYREKIGGFSDDVQLYSVWGLSTAVVDRLLKQFTVKTPKIIQKININTASASDIATIPGVSFDLAKDIWEFRVLRERIESLSDLNKIEALSATKLQLISVYLTTE